MNRTAKEIGEQPAFPIAAIIGPHGTVEPSAAYIGMAGLTIRQYLEVQFLGPALQAQASYQQERSPRHGDLDHGRTYPPEAYINIAFQLAELLVHAQLQSWSDQERMDEKRANEKLSASKGAA